MKTIGNIIKEARITKNYSRVDIGDMTHIKTDFIGAIEKGEWEKLPEFTTTLGFVKSIAHFLDIDETLVVSTFRREYPPSLRREAEKQISKRALAKSEFGKKIVWGPRLTFLFGVFVVVAIVLGYLGFQYRKFNSPPSLTVSEPTNNQTITSYIVSVNGNTDPDATISVNDQPVIVENSGSYTTQIEVSTDTDLVIVRAKSRSGKETTIQRKIKVVLQNKQ